jgi:hypothetical protein
MAQELKKEVNVKEVKDKILFHFANIFQAEMIN